MSDADDSARGYVEEEVLTRYVWHNYSHLMLAIEQKAALALLARQHAAGTSSASVAAWLRERHCRLDDPEVNAALSAGGETFRHAARERLLREQGDQIQINRCPSCARIVRTPRAQLCLWCGHAWHAASPTLQDPGAATPGVSHEEALDEPH